MEENEKELLHYKTKKSKQTNLHGKIDSFDKLYNSYYKKTHHDMYVLNVPFLAKTNYKMAWLPNWPEVYLTLDSPQIVLCGKDHDEGSQKELPNKVVISSIVWALFNEFSINRNPAGHSSFCIPKSKLSRMGLAALPNARINSLEEVYSSFVF